VHACTCTYISPIECILAETGRDEAEGEGAAWNRRKKDRGNFVDHIQEAAAASRSKKSKEKEKTRPVVSHSIVRDLHTCLTHSISCAAVV